MIDFKNKIYVGSNKRESLYDCTIQEDAKAVIIFVHGYKGFKDWGAWGLMGKKLIEAGFGFVKMNLSHNGGTTNEPIDFADLEAFGENRYSYELYDVGVILDEVHRMIHQELQKEIPIVLLGHSRGGGVVLLKASQDERISSVISLAGISDIGSRFPSGDDLENWKREGVVHVINGRTNQEMPHFFSFYEDFIENKKELNIEEACQSLTIPSLIIHGDMDQAVSISEGNSLAAWTNTRLKIIKGTEHTFGIRHPWDSETLSQEMNEVCEAIVDFLNK